MMHLLTVRVQVP